MQQSAWPAAVPWDPAAVAPPGELLEALVLLADTSAILLVAGAEGRSAGWAATAAVALADQAAATQPCVLLDLVLDGGELHSLLGMESLEGVNDIFLYGASLRHVIQRPAGRAFDFAPAGLPGDPELVLTHRRWYRLLGEVKASASQMLAYVPADAPGLEYLAQRIPHVIVLGSQQDRAFVSQRLGEFSQCVLALAPPGASAAVAAPLENPPVEAPSWEAVPVEPVFVEVAPAEAVAEAAEVDATPVQEEPAEVAPIEAAPVEVIAVHEEPAEVVPPEAAAVEVVAVQEEPAEPVPLDAAPLEPGPVEVASVEALVEQPAPLEDEPVENGGSDHPDAAQVESVPAPPSATVPDNGVSAPPTRPAAKEPTFTRRVSDEAFEAIRLPRQGAREKRIAELRSEQRAARMAPPPRQTAPVEAPDAKPQGEVPDASILRMPTTRKPAPLTEPTFVTLQSRDDVKSRRSLYIALSFALLVVLAVAAAAWMYYDRYLRPGRNEQQLPAAVVPPPTRAGLLVPLPYSVAVEAHLALPLAAQRVDELRAQERDIDFYVAPIQYDSMLYYRVMAGPVADSAEASALLRRLLEKGHKTGASPSDVLQSPLAFMLGEYDSRSAAEAREREAARLAIPAYVVPVPGADGSTRQRVYAGAYAGFAEAEVMRQLLRSAGLPDSLVQRVGTRR